MTPRGPLSFPPGGAHWYAIREIGYPDPETFDATYTAVGKWLDDLLAEHGIPIERTILGGLLAGRGDDLRLRPGRRPPAARRR